MNSWRGMPERVCRPARIHIPRQFTFSTPQEPSSPQKESQPGAVTHNGAAIQRYKPPFPPRSGCPSGAARPGKRKSGRLRRPPSHGRDAALLARCSTVRCAPLPGTDSPGEESGVRQGAGLPSAAPCRAPCGPTGAGKRGPGQPKSPGPTQGPTGRCRRPVGTQPHTRLLHRHQRHADRTRPHRRPAHGRRAAQPPQPTGTRSKHPSTDAMPAP